MLKQTAEPDKGRELITRAQQLARDAEHHALLSASLASQADRLMVAGLRMLETRTSATSGPRVTPARRSWNQSSGEGGSLRP